jgi:hypothetical protein
MSEQVGRESPRGLRTRQLVHHPLEHRAEALWTVALGAVGQLLLSWILARAAQSAARRDPQVGRTP